MVNPITIFEYVRNSNVRRDACQSGYVFWRMYLNMTPILGIRQWSLPGSSHLIDDPERVAAAPHSLMTPTRRIRGQTFGGISVDYVWIGIGAAVGANARYVLGQLVAPRLGSDFPFGTLIINVTGSLLIGLIFTLLADRLLADTHWRLLLVIGLLGGYTTFSTFSLETIAMLQVGRWVPAFVYAGASVMLSLVGCYVGIILARLLAQLLERS